MSHEAMSWAYRQQVGSAWAKFVLVTLADYADERHSCYPSQATLAGRCEMGVRTVRRALQELERQELIRREPRMRTGGRGRSSDRYVLAVADQPATSAAGQDGRQVERPTGRPRTTNRPHLHDQPATSDRGRTVTEPSGEPSDDDAHALVRQLHHQLGRPLVTADLAHAVAPLLDTWATDDLLEHLLDVFDREDGRRGVTNPTAFLLTILSHAPTPPPAGEDGQAGRDRRRRVTSARTRARNLAGAGDLDREALVSALTADLAGLDDVDDLARQIADDALADVDPSRVTDSVSHAS